MESEALKLEQEPVAHCEAGPEYCVQCKLEDRSIVLAAAVRYVKNNTPPLVSDEICRALATPPQRKPLDKEPPPWWPAVENILNEYGLQAVDFVADFKNALAQPAQEPFGYLSIGDNPIFQKEKPEIGRWETVYTAPPQRTWVEPTGNEWFEWWRVSQVANETEAEIDFADFLIIAQAVITKLKEKNNG